MLLEELEHRVVNSLQIIASIIMLKARAVESEETRRHLEDAHNRVISVATVQKHLHGSVANAIIEMAPYLETLCAALAQSMISDNRPVSIQFDGKGGGTATRRNAESIGLIVTELVINSLKHAFKDVTEDGAIRVSYDVSGTDWQLAVCDNGTGKPDGVFAQPKTGLGTGVVKALAKQLDAHAELWGQKFRLHTPRSQPQPHSLALASPPQPAPPERSRMEHATPRCHPAGSQTRSIQG